MVRKHIRDMTDAEFEAHVKQRTLILDLLFGSCAAVALAALVTLLVLVT